MKTTTTKKHIGEKPFERLHKTLVIIKDMEEFTQKTGLMHVKIVRKPSAVLVLLTDMKCFTLVGSIIVVNILDNL